MRSLALACLMIAGCGTQVPPASTPDTAPHDAGHDAFAAPDVGIDAGTDANDLDAGIDANDLDASDVDATDDADLDAWFPHDIGPFDAAIVRTTDPPTHPTATPIAPFTECTVTLSTDTIEGADHRDPCTDIPWPSLPPSAGPHYWIWASFGTYAQPVPWGFLVHDLEHGAMVFAYNCATDADCDPVRAELAQIIADYGVDPVCRMETTETRFIVVPDPTLPVPIAAVAWRHLYEATCLDDASLRAFVTAHYGMGSESLCAAPLYAPPDGGAWCPPTWIPTP